MMIHLMKYSPIEERMVAMIRKLLLPATMALLLAPETSAQAGLLTVEDTVVVTDTSGKVLATKTFGPQSGSSRPKELSVRRE
jgi:hypothetical protein